MKGIYVVGIKYPAAHFYLMSVNGKYYFGTDISSSCQYMTLAGAAGAYRDYVTQIAKMEFTSFSGISLRQLFIKKINPTYPEGE